MRCTYFLMPHPSGAARPPCSGSLLPSGRGDPRRPLDYLSCRPLPIRPPSKSRLAAEDGNARVGAAPHRSVAPDGGLATAGILPAPGMAVPPSGLTSYSASLSLSSCAACAVMVPQPGAAAASLEAASPPTPASRSTCDARRRLSANQRVGRCPPSRSPPASVPCRPT